MLYTYVVADQLSSGVDAVEASEMKREMSRSPAQRT